MDILYKIKLGINTLKIKVMIAFIIEKMLKSYLRWFRDICEEDM